ncbi:MAG: sulfotransferase [Alphaproteobacteria bacterium]|nr:sulfotransferase [Alphaproteobacteria bacterium]
MQSALPNSEYSFARKQAEAAQRAGKHTQNVAAAQAFQARFPRDAFANHFLAQTLYQAGRKFDALGFGEAAAQLGGLMPDYSSPLAALYQEFGLLERMSALLTAALAKFTDSPQLISDMAYCQQALGKLAEAETLFRKALEMPLPAADREETTKLLADLLRASYRMQEAEALFLPLKSAPAHRVIAHVLLAQAKGQNAQSPIAKDIENLLVQEARSLTAADKAQLHLVLGRLQENSKDYDHAFASWKKARELDSPRYDRAAIEQFHARLKSFYAGELFSKTRLYASPSSKPVFVVGMPRSGTTLLEQIIGAHSHAAGIGELGRITRQNQTLLAAYDQPGGQAKLVSSAMRGELVARAKEFLTLAEMIGGSEARHLVDKTPTQFMDAGYIHLIFPNARIINLNRHPADTFISTYQNNFSHDYSFAFSQEGFAHFYMQREKLLAHWRDVIPDSMLDVSYEGLVAQPEAHVRRILDFIGLEWEDACLRFFEGNKSVRTFSRDQVRQSINTKSVGRWRNYEKHLGPLFVKLKDYGYQPPPGETP